MAKNIYVGVSDVARKVTKAYVGVSGTARKIIKGYVGVNGVAQQFFSSTTLTPFTTSPIARSWSGTGTAANTVYTATNTYGEWKCYSDTASSAEAYIIWKAFDGDTGTRGIITARSTNGTVTLEPPSGVTILPTKLMLSLGTHVRNGLVFEGRRAGTTTWDTFYTLASSTGTTATTTLTPSVTTTYFYDQFRVVYRSDGVSYSPTVREFDITEGTIAQ